MVTITMVVVDGSQPSIFLYFNLNAECSDRIVRELDALMNCKKLTYWNVTFKMHCTVQTQTLPLSWSVCD